MNKLDVNYYLRTSDFDKESRMHPAAVLDLFQDVAGCHAIKLGCSFEDMIKKNLLWMVTRVRFTLIKTPKKNSFVQVSTWPLAPNRVLFQREYRVKDDEGSDLIIGSSEWAAVDCVQRKLAPSAGVYPPIQLLTDRMYEGRLPRLHDFECEGDGCEVTPTFSDIDCNGHVNNTKYAIYVMNSLEIGNDDLITDFQIDYHKEVGQGERITLFNKREGDVILAKGINGNGDTMFLCRFAIKNKAQLC